YRHLIVLFKFRKELALQSNHIVGNISTILIKQEIPEDLPIESMLTHLSNCEPCISQLSLIFTSFVGIEPQNQQDSEFRITADQSLKSVMDFVYCHTVGLEEVAYCIEEELFDGYAQACKSYEEILEHISICQICQNNKSVLVKFLDDLSKS